MLGYKIRGKRDGDRNFILDSFKRSYVDGRPAKGSLYQRLDDWLPLLLDNESFEWLVACDNQDEDHLLGWSCRDGDALIYVYVKHVYRGLGLGRALCKGLSLPYRLVNWTAYADKVSIRRPDLVRRLGL